MTIRGSLWKHVLPFATQIANECRCDRLRRAARKATSIYDRHLARIGLSVVQLHLLATVWNAGPKGIGVTGLAMRMDLDKSTLSRNVRQLQRRKLLERGPRRGRFEITPMGANAVRDAIPCWRSAQTTVAYPQLVREALRRVSDIDLELQYWGP